MALFKNSITLLLLSFVLFSFTDCKKVEFKPVEQPASDLIDSNNDNSNNGNEKDKNEQSPNVGNVTCVFLTDFDSIAKNVDTHNIDFECVNSSTGKKKTNVQCSLNNSNFTGCNSGDSFSFIEGNNTIALKAVIDGDLGYSNTVTINIDTVPPEIKNRSFVQNIGNNSEFTFDFVDNGSGIASRRCKVTKSDNDSNHSNNVTIQDFFDCPADKIIKNLPGNENLVLELKAIDHAGNEVTEYIEFSSQVISQGNQNCTLPNDIYSNQSTQNITFNCVQNETFSCSVNNGQKFDCYPNVEFSLVNLVHGTHVLNIEGQSSGHTKSMLIHIDTVPPVVSIYNPSPNNLTPSFDFSAVDNQSGVKANSYECKLTQENNIISNWTSCSSPKTFSSLIQIDLNYEFHVRVMDNANNVGTKTYGFSTKSQNGPSCTISSFPGNQIHYLNTNSTDINFSCLSSFNIKSYECKLTNLTDNTESVFVCDSDTLHNAKNLLNEKLYHFEVSAIDSNDQIGTSNAVRFLIDTTAPEINITKVDNDSPLAKVYFSPAANINDIKEYKCKLDNGIWENCSPPFILYTNLTDGVTYRSFVKAIDMAGNESPIKDITWVGAPQGDRPSCNINHPFQINSSSNVDPVNFSFSCNGIAGVKEILCSKDNSTYSTCQSPYSYSVIGEGNKSFYLKSIDNNDKESSLEVFTWNYNPVKPTVDITSLQFIAHTKTQFAFYLSNPIEVPGLTKFMCSFNGSPFSECSSPFEINDGVDPGQTYQFKVYAVSSSGAIGDEVTYEYTNGDYSMFGSCSLDCSGNTTQGFKERTCDNPSPQNDGLNCDHLGFPKVSCDLGIQCPAKVDGGWSFWVDVSSCDQNGMKTQSRLCNNPEPANGGADCVGNSSQTISCKTDGGFSEWEDATSCSIDGLKTQVRTCTDPKPSYGGNDCVGERSREVSCPVDGMWSAWVVGACNPQTGIKKSTRECNNPAPLNGGAACVGEDELEENCTVDGGWSDWTIGECLNGQRTSTRTCSNPSPLNGGANCVGPVEETTSCVIDGGWTPWEVAIPCDPHSGLVTQVRTCTNPTPMYGGAACPDSAIQTIACDVDGGWEVKDEITIGIKTYKVQTCTDPTKKLNGLDCPPLNGYTPVVGSDPKEVRKLVSCTDGSSIESDCTACPSGMGRDNNNICGPTIDGGWSPWVNGACNQADGKQEQTRTCTNPAPSHGGQDCNGLSSQKINCDVNGGWSNWTNNGVCNQATGQQSQLRTCTNPIPRNNGSTCNGPNSQMINCDVNGGWSSAQDFISGVKKFDQRVCNNPLKRHNGLDCPPLVGFSIVPNASPYTVQKLIACTNGTTVESQCSSCPSNQKLYNGVCVTPTWSASKKLSGHAYVYRRSCSHKALCNNLGSPWRNWIHNGVKNATHCASGSTPYVVQHTAGNYIHCKPPAGRKANGRCISGYEPKGQICVKKIPNHTVVTCYSYGNGDDDDDDGSDRRKKYCSSKHPIKNMSLQTWLGGHCRLGQNFGFTKNQKKFWVANCRGKFKLIHK